MRSVAITGFGIVSPIGTGVGQFYDRLLEGRSGIGRISRFDASSFGVQLAGEVKRPSDLPAEVDMAARHDPKVGFAFTACAEALAQAGIDRLGRDGLLHIGTSLEIFDLQKVVTQGKIDFAATVEKAMNGAGAPLQFPLDTAAGLISSFFGNPRARLTNVSACAASAQAIGHGFQEVRAGHCETAVCGGFDSMINPLGVGGFQLLGALTMRNELAERACRPFDAERSGAVLGEGAAIVVMEPLEKAQAEGKRILAEVCGYGSSLDAHNLCAPDPAGDGAVRSMRLALSDARLSPARIDHINVHGTGTRLNDEIEAAAIRKVFVDNWEAVPVSATKSMTGHLIAAAGAIELGACLCVFDRGAMPFNPSLETVGPNCELAHITGRPAPFKGEHVLSNSFGFGGQNATLILRRPAI